MCYSHRACCLLYYLAKINSGIHMYQFTFKGSGSRLCAYACDDVNLLFMSQSQTRSELKRECECLAVSQISWPFDVRFVKRILNRFSSLKMSSATAEISSCKCSGVCSRKDGSKAKGCPCKTRGEFCSASCKCLLTGKRCQNQVGFHFFFRHRFSPFISFN